MRFRSNCENILSESIFEDVKYENSIRMQISRKVSYLLLQYVNIGVSRYIRHKLCKLLLPLPNGLVICPTPYDINLLVDPKDLVGKYIYYFGEWEPGTLWVLRNYLNKGDVFLDVGAYIGSISCAASRLVGNQGFIYSIEPSSDNYNMLCENIKINNLKNIYPFKIALGSEISVARIIIRNQWNRGADSLAPNEKSGEKVLVTTIDTLIETKRIPPPNFIKIDVEGYEYEVLKGAEKLLKSSCAPILCVEYNRVCGNDIYDYLKSINNYSIYTLQNSTPYTLIKKKKEEIIKKTINLFCFQHTCKKLRVFPSDTN